MLFRHALVPFIFRFRVRRLTNWISLQSSTSLGIINTPLRTHVVGMLDDGDVALDDLFRHVVGGIVQLNLIQLRFRAYLVNGGIQQVALAGADFTDCPVRIADVISGGELAVLVRGEAVDKGVSLIQPIHSAGQRTVALGRARFHIALGDGDAELLQHVIHALVSNFVPLDGGCLGIRHHITDGGIHLLQYIARADEHVFKTRHAVSICHSILIHRLPGEGCAIQVEGHALHQSVLAGFRHFQAAALQLVVEIHGRGLAADDGHALGFLGFIFVNGLLGYGINAGVEVVVALYPSPVMVKLIPATCPSSEVLTSFMLPVFTSRFR